ncbi:unnamed protein product [Urochloa decumbens]|uniref:RNase H type-1 domain-containing protein n=1 Tax=Urochloa decumbens TaxID=240449 RepID=A0ABC8VC46_9POAL
MCGMWSLWMLRNQRRHGDRGLSLYQAVVWVRDTAFDLWQLLHPYKTPSARDKVSWKPPREGWIKCNFDGAHYQDGSGVTGAVLRDHEGEFRHASARWYASGTDALTMEARACRDGLVLAQRQGAAKVAFETDCLELVHLWSMKGGQRSAIMAILREIDDIRSSFEEFSLCFVSRVCNTVAHVLAKQVSSEHVLGEWLEAPSCVHNCLMAECNPSHG